MAKTHVAADSTSDWYSSLTMASGDANITDGGFLMISVGTIELHVQVNISIL